MVLLLAAPVGAASPVPASPRSVSGVAGQAPPRDVVLGNPGPAAARISATATEARYPIGDGSGATIAVAETAACQATCTAADPQRIADFVGTLVHGPEVELLTVQLDAPHQIAFDCGFGAQACYYSGKNLIVVSGDETPAPDGASRDFVLAHEYGHHVARHRRSPAPFPPAIDWGTARWASHEQVCRGRRRGTLFPGGGLHYFRDPGEAFAEAFAFNRFPDAQVRWRWLPSLKPDEAAFRAIRRDTLAPWLGRRSFLLSGRTPPRRRGGTFRSFHTPLDGTVSLLPGGHPRRYRLSLKNPAGRTLRTSRHGLGARHRLSFTVCGQSRLRLAIKSTRPTTTAFKLQVQRP